MNKELLVMINELEKERDQARIDNQKLIQQCNDISQQKDYWKNQVENLQRQFDEKLKLVLLEADRQIDELQNQIRNKQESLKSYEQAFQNQKNKLQKIKNEKSFMYFQKEKEYQMEIVKMILIYKILYLILIQLDNHQHKLKKKEYQKNVIVFKEIKHNNKFLNQQQLIILHLIQDGESESLLEMLLKQEIYNY